MALFSRGCRGGNCPVRQPQGNTQNTANTTGGSSNAPSVTTQQLPQAGWFSSQGPTATFFNRFTPQQQQVMDQAGQKGISSLQQLQGRPDPLRGIDARARRQIQGRIGQQPTQQVPRQMRQFGVDPRQIGRQTDFDPIERRARSQFQQQTVPGLAERFSTMGGGGQRSSAFRQSLGQAGANLEEGLASQRAQFGAQRRGLDQQLLQSLMQGGIQERGLDQSLLQNMRQGDIQRMGLQYGVLPSLFQAGLQPQFESIMSPRQPSTFERGAGVVGQAATSLLPFLF